MELKKQGKEMESPSMGGGMDGRLSNLMDDDLQFILENFEFQPEVADDVSYLQRLNSWD